MGKMSDKAPSLDSKMQSLNISYLAQVAGISSLVTGYVKLVNAMSNFAMQSIKTYSAFEKIQSEMETFFNDADKGKATFEDLRRLSNSTTFGVDELANSFTELANSGVAVDTINDKLVMLGNLAGGSKGKFAELTSIYSKIASTGRAGSMQIQQLATRGIPIIKTLKDMGVQGVATADQITEAFKRMTDEGGQFYNAMGNILDTIEGKEGEVQDFFKEFMVNFAEATGWAQMYKNALGFVRNALEQLADLFRNIGGDNPVFKALFNGALVAGLIALAGVIGGVLISTLIALNTQLGITATLSAIINPASAGIALLIAGMTGVAVGIGVWASEQERLGTGLDETTKKIREQEASIADLRERLENGGVLNESELIRVNHVEATKLIAERNKLEQQVEEARRDSMTWDEKAFQLELDRISAINQELAKMEEENQKLKKIYDQKQMILKAEREHIMSLKEQVSSYQDAYNSAQEIVNNSKEQKTMEMLKQIEKWQGILLSGQKTIEVTQRTASGATLTSQTTTALTNSDIELFTKAIQEMTKQMKESFQPAEWAKTLASALGVEATSNSASVIYNAYHTRVNAGEKNINSWVNENYARQFWETVLRTSANAFDVVTSSGLFSKDSNSKTLMMQDMKYALGKRADNFGGEFIGTDEYVEGLEDALELITKLEEIDKDDADLLALKARYVYEYLNSLDEQVRKSKLTTEELRKQELMKIGFSESGAKDAIHKEKEAEYDTKIVQATEKLESAFTYNNQLQARVQVANERYAKAVFNLTDETKALKDRQTELTEATKEMIQANAEQMALNTIQNVASGSDAGDFIQGAAQGGVWMGLLNMLFGALGRALGSIQGITYALSPITELLTALAPIFKVFFYVCMLITPLFKKLGEAIMWVLNVITFGLFSNMNDAYDELVSELDGTAEAFRDLQEDMKKLSDAIAEQSEYYLQKKRELNSQTYVEGIGWQTKSVNDMILTPQGQFSTHPDDYIIATKTPQDLGGRSNGGVVMIEPVIQNYASSDTQATVTTKKEGDITQMLVVISKKIASDVATGSNGWDSAMSQRENRIQGRRVSL